MKSVCVRIFVRCLHATKPGETSERVTIVLCQKCKKGRITMA